MKFLATLLAVVLTAGCIFPPNAEAFGNRGSRARRQSAFERGFNAGQRNQHSDFARGFRAGQRSARGVRGICH